MLSRGGTELRPQRRFQDFEYSLVLALSDVEAQEAASRLRNAERVAWGEDDIIGQSSMRNLCRLDALRQATPKKYSGRLRYPWLQAQRLEPRGGSACSGIHDDCRQPQPGFVVAIGVIIGYPLLTAFALQRITSAHSMVFVGLLPLATATFAVLRGGERPRAAFWLFSFVGSENRLADFARE